MCVDQNVLVSNRVAIEKMHVLVAACVVGKNPPVPAVAHNKVIKHDKRHCDCITG